MAANQGKLGINVSGNVNEQTNPISALRPIVLTAAGNGIVIDRQKFNSFLVKLTTGKKSGTPTTAAVTVKVQDDTDSAGGSMVDAVAGGAGSVVTGTITDDAEDNQITLFVDANALNQFVRVVVTPAFTGGSTPGILCSVVIIPGEQRGEAPVTQEAQT